MATKQKETIQKRNTVDTVAKYFLLIADVLLLLFFGIMYRNYEDQAFARLRAEATSVCRGLTLCGMDYLESVTLADLINGNIAAKSTDSGE